MKNYFFLIVFIALFMSCKKEKPEIDAPLIGTWSHQSEITNYYNGKSKLVRSDTLSAEFVEFTEIAITEKSFKWLENKDEGYIGSNRYTLSKDSLNRNHILLNNSRHKYQYTIKANILKLTNVVPGFFKPNEEPYYGIREITFIRKQ